MYVIAWLAKIIMASAQCAEGPELAQYSVYMGINNKQLI